MSAAGGLDAEGAFRRYEAVRGRLPAAAFPAASRRAATLEEVADGYDAFVLDAFGVLNVGATPIPGAVERMARLRAMGKRLIVLTNAASDPRVLAHSKYGRLGFDFVVEEVVSSRDVAAARLEGLASGASWGAIAAAGDGFEDMGAEMRRWTAADPFEADAFVMLSSADLDAATVEALTGALARRARPLVVANPDIVAPREDGLTLEPGYHAHAIADATGIAPTFFGKPFGEAYDDVLGRLGGPAPGRVAMVGDTLHTDVLGGAAAGMGTVLVERHGLFAGRDVAAYVERSGIVPDVICATT